VSWRVQKFAKFLGVVLLIVFAAEQSERGQISENDTNHATHRHCVNAHSSAVVDWCQRLLTGAIRISCESTGQFCCGPIERLGPRGVIKRKVYPTFTRFTNAFVFKPYDAIFNDFINVSHL